VVAHEEHPLWLPIPPTMEPGAGASHSVPNPDAVPFRDGRGNLKASKILVEIPEALAEEFAEERA